MNQFKKTTDDNKFKLICETCQIKSGMKILEIGFGEGDFINYIKKHYNIDVTGVSISDEQVKLIRSRGFVGYTMNSWDMTPDVIGTYDLILQCGNLEYILCTGESETKYIDYCNIIKKLLNKNGKYFVTCIHFNENFGKFSLYDNIRCYFCGVVMMDDIHVEKMDLHDMLKKQVLKRFFNKIERMIIL